MSIKVNIGKFLFLFLTSQSNVYYYIPIATYPFFKISFQFVHTIRMQIQKAVVWYKNQFHWVSKQKLHITTSLYVYTKTTKRKFIQDWPLSSRIKVFMQPSLAEELLETVVMAYRITNVSANVDFFSFCSYERLVTRSKVFNNNRSINWACVGLKNVYGVWHA